MANASAPNMCHSRPKLGPQDFREWTAAVSPDGSLVAEDGCGSSAIRIWRSTPSRRSGCRRRRHAAAHDAISVDRRPYTRPTHRGVDRRRSVVRNKRPQLGQFSFSNQVAWLLERTQPRGCYPVSILLVVPAGARTFQRLSSMVWTSPKRGVGCSSQAAMIESKFCPVRRR